MTKNGGYFHQTNFSMSTKCHCRSLLIVQQHTRKQQRRNRGVRRKYVSVTLEVDLKNGKALYRFALLLLKTSVELQCIFKGKGNRISEDEKVAYHKSVDIYWQECAWADRKVSNQWVE